MDKHFSISEIIKASDDILNTPSKSSKINNIKITKNNLIKIANKVGSDVILGLYKSPMILQGKNISKINKKLNIFSFF